MSQIKRMKLQLSTPAFSLAPMEDTDHMSDTPARSAAQAQEISDILPHICLGSWRDAENADVVRKKGITHVLNVAKECPSLKEQELMDSLKVVKKTIALVDAHSENILVHFEEAFEFIDMARSKGGRVLVHCRRGISRSPAIVTGYIMTKTGCSYEAALSFVTACRSSVCLNLAFREILLVYKPTVLRPDNPIALIVQNGNSSATAPQNGGEAGGPIGEESRGAASAEESQPPVARDASSPPVVGSTSNNDSEDAAKDRSLTTTGDSARSGNTALMGITPASEGEQSPLGDDDHDEPSSPAYTNKNTRTSAVFGEDSEGEGNEDDQEEGGKGSTSF